jgi:hypothetical protein
LIWDGKTKYFGLNNSKHSPNLIYSRFNITQESKTLNLCPFLGSSTNIPQILTLPWNTTLHASGTASWPLIPVTSSDYSDAHFNEVTLEFGLNTSRRIWDMEVKFYGSPNLGTKGRHFRYRSRPQYMRVYPKVSGLTAWSENCKWYSSLPLGAVVSLFCESV